MPHGARSRPRHRPGVRAAARRRSAPSETAGELRRAARRRSAPTSSSRTLPTRPRRHARAADGRAHLRRQAHRRRVRARLGAAGRGPRPHRAGGQPAARARGPPIDGTRLKVWRVRPLSACIDAEPGTVFGHTCFATGDGALELVEVSPRVAAPWTPMRGSRSAWPDPLLGTLSKDSAKGTPSNNASKDVSSKASSSKASSSKTVSSNRDEHVTTSVVALGHVGSRVDDAGAYTTRGGAERAGEADQPQRHATVPSPPASCTAPCARNDASTTCWNQRRQAPLKWRLDPPVLSHAPYFGTYQAAARHTAPRHGSVDGRSSRYAFAACPRVRERQSACAHPAAATVARTVPTMPYAAQSYPDWLVARLTHELGADDTACRAWSAMNEPAAVTLRPDPAPGSPGGALSRAARRGRRGGSRAAGPRRGDRRRRR